MSCRNYTDELVFLENAPVQAKFLLYSLGQATREIILSVNPNKTAFICFKQDWAISTLHFKWETTQICRPFDVLRQQYRIYRKRCQHAYSEDVVFYWPAVDHMEIWCLW